VPPFPAPGYPPGSGAPQSVVVGVPARPGDLPPEGEAPARPGGLTPEAEARSGGLAPEGETSACRGGLRQAGEGLGCPGGLTADGEAPAWPGLASPGGVAPRAHVPACPGRSWLAAGTGRCRSCLERRPPLAVRLVGTARFELATPSPPDWCANQAAPRPEAGPKARNGRQDITVTGAPRPVDAGGGRVRGQPSPPRPSRARCRPVSSRGRAVPGSGLGPPGAPVCPRTRRSGAGRAPGSGGSWG
jgi:hypothetical protein